MSDQEPYSNRVMELAYKTLEEIDQIDRYRGTLQAHSAPLMNFIEWRSTPERNVEVLNDTSDLYRYFDCTEAAEFLYECVQRTVDNDLPREIEFLRRQDEAIQQIMETVEMPDDLAGKLVTFIRQNSGRLGKKRREGEFNRLTDDEVAAIESIVRATFTGIGDR